MDALFCPRCGKRMKKGGRFCTHCGSPLPQAPAPPPPVAPKPTPPPPFAGYPVYYPSPVARKAKLPAYAVILIVLVAVLLLAASAFAVWHFLLKQQEPGQEVPEGTLPFQANKTRPETSPSTMATTVPPPSTTAPPPTETEETGPLFDSAELAAIFRGIAPLSSGDDTGRITRWEVPVRIQIAGNPTARDRDCLASMIQEVNALGSALEISLVEEDANVFFYYVSRSDFNHVLGLEWDEDEIQKTDNLRG